MANPLPDEPCTHDCRECAERGECLRDWDFVECVACGRECPPNRRWCSLQCFYAEDGYPAEDDRDDREDEDDD